MVFFYYIAKILDKALIWWWYILQATKSKIQEQAIVNVNTNKALKERKALWLVRVITTSVWAGTIAQQRVAPRDTNVRTGDQNIVVFHL